MFSILKKIIIFFPVQIIIFYQNIPSIWYNLKIILNIPVEKIVKTSSVSGKVALVASFQKNASASFDAMLKELRARGFKILLVSNSKLSVEFNFWLMKRVDILIVRENIGRDFGAYKCGFLYLNSKGYLKKISNLLLLNDSIIFPIINTKYFWNRFLNIRSDLVGVYENFFPKYHLQSFFLLFNFNLINSEHLLLFWRKYANWNSRRHALYSGEVKLSQFLKKKGFKLSALVNPMIFANFENKIKKSQKLLYIFNPLEKIDKNNFAKIGEKLEYSNCSHTLWEISISLLKIPILKKDLIIKKTARLFDIIRVCVNYRLKISILEIIDIYKYKKIHVELSFWEKLMIRLDLK
jgi:hypothetical protein